MRQSLFTVALLLLVAFAWVLRDLLVVVAFAGLFAYALDPVVSWVERRRLPGRGAMPRGVAAALVMLLLALVAAAALTAALPPLVHQFAEFARTAPGSLQHLEQETRALIESRGGSNVLGGGTGDTSGTVASLLGEIEHGVIATVGGVLGSLSGLALLTLLPLFAFYLLADVQRMRTRLLEMVPPDRLTQTHRLLDALDGALRAYVRGQALVCLAMGAAVTVVLAVLGVPVALFLGVVVAFAEIIPIAGFWFAALAIALAGYSVRPELALMGVVAYTVVNNLMQTFVSPRLLGRQVRLPPLVVSLSVIGGGMLLGPAGAILALPAAAMGRALLDEFGLRGDGAPSPGSAVPASLSS